MYVFIYAGIYIHIYVYIYIAREKVLKTNIFRLHFWT